MRQQTFCLLSHNSLVFNHITAADPSKVEILKTSRNSQDIPKTLSRYDVNCFCSYGYHVQRLKKQEGLYKLSALGNKNFRFYDNRSLVMYNGFHVT